WPMQYICSEKPVFLLKKAKALTGQSQCFHMAHATYCLCQRTTLPFHSPFTVHRSPFIIHHSPFPSPQKQAIRKSGQ
ncbi:MAG: hypothetical protein J6C92_03375, partial [Bacteroidaceae bacterium]|nr:hypothetical protein [Bacteroidaceae bacterium]